MEETQRYFIDVLKIAPDNSICYIQSPHIEILSVINTLNPKKEGPFMIVILNKTNREKLIKATLENHIEEFIHHIEIKYANELIFEGDDGMEYGEISKRIQLPSKFIYNYVNKDMCLISKDW